MANLNTNTNSIFFKHDRAFNREAAERAQRFRNFLTVLNGLMTNQGLSEAELSEIRSAFTRYNIQSAFFLEINGRQEQAEQVRAQVRI